MYCYYCYLLTHRSSFEFTKKTHVNANEDGQLKTLIGLCLLTENDPETTAVKTEWKTERH